MKNIKTYHLKFPMHIKNNLRIYIYFLYLLLSSRGERRPCFSILCLLSHFYTI